MPDSDQLFQKYQAMINKIAGDIYYNKELYLSKDIEFDDLRREGFFGLLKANEKFDPEKGTKFSTFAFNKIRWEMLQFLLKQRMIIFDLTEHEIKFLNKMGEKREKFFQKNCRYPDVKELALILQVKTNTVRKFLLKEMFLDSLNTQLFDQ